MNKQIIVAALAGLFSLGALAQASAPMAQPETPAADSSMSKPHHMKKAHTHRHAHQQQQTSAMSGTQDAPAAKQ
ncbi:ABC-type nickel/cobalt efflux system permease component RcnA [Paraburkholderia sp. GAS448]|uniref:hypothetical protein n=1 Tax=Paraburkholderia sp. GAS448 TaxID=3035136 RepID=UPI003D19F439